MQIIAPSYITDSNLTFCDIPATDSGTSEWDSTTSYVTGQRVVVNYLIDGVTPGVHKIYECTWHGTGNVNMYPPDHLNVESSYIWWTRVSATNRWRLFDLIVAPDRATVTVNVLPTVWASGEVWEPGTEWAQESYAGMRVDTTPGLIDSIAVMNANCTNLSLIMTNAGVEVYREEKISSTVTDYNGVFTGLPAYPNATASVSVRNSAGDLKIGEIVFGNSRTIGTAKYGVDVGLIDYSQKDVDAYGNFSILERSYSKRISCQFTMAAASHSGILRLLEKYRSVPLVWIISDLYSTTITYGFYRDLQVSIPYPTMAEGSVNIEGLGADYVHAEVVPDPWVPVWDGIIRLIVPDFFTMITVATPTTSKIEEAPVAIGPGQLLLTFEGADAATTWPELAQGLAADYQNACELDTAQYFSGSSSLRFPDTNSDTNYTIPGISTDFTFIARYRYTGDGEENYPIWLGKAGTGPGWLPRIEIFHSGTWMIRIYDTAGNALVNDVFTSPPAADTWATWKFVVSGRNVSFYIDNALYNTWTAAIDDPVAGMDSFWAGNYNTTAGYDFWLDLVEWSNAPSPEAIMPRLFVPNIIPTISAGCYLTQGDCTISQASPAVVGYVAHGLLNTRKVMFYTSGALPAPLVAGQIYFVSNKSDDAFNVALTSGGSTIDTTNAGSGTHSLHPLVI
jgi:hypothetical protein